MNKAVATILAIIVTLLVAAAVYLINPFEKKVPGALQVVVEGTSASLFLDDQYLDKSPYIDRKINPGKYTLNIIPDASDKKAMQLPISINSGTLTVVFWKPETSIEQSSGVIYELYQIEDKNKGELEVKTVPASAIINFSNQTQQFAPYIFKDIEPGQHNLQIQLPAYQLPEQKITIQAGYRLSIYAQLGEIKGESASTTTNSQTNQESDISQENQEVTNASQILILPTNFFQEKQEVLRVREKNEITSKTVGYVHVGYHYPYSKKDDEWFFISFEDALDRQKKEGWVSAQYSQEASVSSATDSAQLD